ncbi:Protein Bouncer [Labeo rohita]|uniref:Protein Bouncer n=1 Tax=Labeo rohita TaxID=84645 RepID=A0ABQ8LTP0_LABRO|nr:protein Bouncer [Labeo rohita]KAI2653790.1 Protein Bouncer [Labeo rohita]
MKFFIFSKAGLHWIPGLVFLVLCVHPSAVLCENLYCYYCPQTSFNRTCRHVLSECRPQELCFTADGRFGRASVLFSKGCMSQRDCARSNSQMIRGNNISFTYLCCDRHYCNSSRGCDHSLALLTVTAIAASVITAGWTRTELL